MKKYVDIIGKFNKEGSLIPMEIIWEGRNFKIDKVTDIRPAASLKAGGVGIRYTCIINGQQRYLFYEVDKWFICITNN